jgi:hypothetical protein
MQTHWQNNKLILVIRLEMEMNTYPSQIEPFYNMTGHENGKFIHG